MPGLTIFTTAEASRLAQVPERTLRRWVSLKHITNHGSPRHVRVDYYDVCAFLNEKDAA